MSKKKRKMVKGDLIQLKRVGIPKGTNPKDVCYTPYLDAEVSFMYDGEVCTEEKYGLKPVNEDWFVKLAWLGNGFYKMGIHPPCKLEVDEFGREAINPVSIEEFLEAKPGVNYGPRRKIRFRATKLPGSPILDVKLVIDIPSKKSSKKSTASSGVSKECEESEDGTVDMAVLASCKDGHEDGNESFINPFKSHEESELILGFVEYDAHLRRHRFYFNTRNPDIKFISDKENTGNLNGLIRDLHKVVNFNLDEHVKRYKQLEELKDESLLKEYGGIVNYMANERFEMTIRDYIRRIRDKTLN